MGFFNQIIHESRVSLCQDKSTPGQQPASFEKNRPVVLNDSIITGKLAGYLDFSSGMNDIPPDESEIRVESDIDSESEGPWPVQVGGPSIGESTATHLVDAFLFSPMSATKANGAAITSGRQEVIQEHLFTESNSSANTSYGGNIPGDQGKGWQQPAESVKLPSGDDMLMIGGADPSSNCPIFNGHYDSSQQTGEVFDVTSNSSEHAAIPLNNFAENLLSSSETASTIFSSPSSRSDSAEVVLDIKSSGESKNANFQTNSSHSQQNQIEGKIFESVTNDVDMIQKETTKSEPSSQVQQRCFEETAQQIGEIFDVTSNSNRSQQNTKSEPSGQVEETAGNVQNSLVRLDNHLNRIGAHYQYEDKNCYYSANGLPVSENSNNSRQENINNNESGNSVSQRGFRGHGNPTLNDIDFTDRLSAKKQSDHKDSKQIVEYKSDNLLSLPNASETILKKQKESNESPVEPSNDNQPSQFKQIKFTEQSSKGGFENPVKASVLQPHSTSSSTKSADKEKWNPSGMYYGADRRRHNSLTEKRNSTVWLGGGNHLHKTRSDSNDSVFQTEKNRAGNSPSSQIQPKYPQTKERGPIVQIGQIEVIVESPQQINTQRESPPSTSNIEGRLYLRRI